MKIVCKKRKIPSKQENTSVQHKTQIEEAERQRIFRRDNIINLYITEELNVRAQNYDAISNKNNFLIKENMENNAINNRVINNTSNNMNNITSESSIRGISSNNLYGKNVNQKIISIYKNPRKETVNQRQTIKICPVQKDYASNPIIKSQKIIIKTTRSNNNSKNITQGYNIASQLNISHNQVITGFREEELIADFNKALINFENFNLKIFLSKIN